MADIAAGSPLDNGTPFQIGNNTKMLTATVLMQLVKDGAVSLDDPLTGVRLLKLS